MRFFDDLNEKLEAAKPILKRAVTRADVYACTIIDLLEEIAANESVVEDQRVKRFALVNGTEREFEVPNGEDWKMVALIVEPVGATTITLSLGGTRRFAKNFTTADTPQIPATIVSSGSTFVLLATGADALVTVIATIKRKRARRVRGAGTALPLGLPLNDGAVPTRHFTDEASELPPGPTEADELALRQEDELPYMNAAPVI